MITCSLMLLNFIECQVDKQPKKLDFLAEIEQYLGNNCDHEKVTLEHICPFNPEKNGAIRLGINDVKRMLGNMVLMDKDNLKEHSFEVKKNEYGKSKYKLAKLRLHSDPEMEFRGCQ